jgi:hypothetical protein
VEDVDRTIDWETIAGCRGFHSVLNYFTFDPILLMVRDFVLLCGPCID